MNGCEAGQSSCSGANKAGSLAAALDCTASASPSRVMTAAEEALKVVEADREHRSLSADQMLMLRMVMPSFAAQLQQLQQGLFRWFQHQGFWRNAFHDILSGEETRLKKMEKLGLIVTEVAEAMEAVRKDDRQNEAEELADVLVRVLDYAGGFNIDLAGAFEKKMIANYGRPFKHGKKF